MKNKKGSACGQAGQVVLVLILVMTVALAIGLSVIQKSLLDVSTSTKVEQSQRAFSAAEAGIEKALKGDNGGVVFPENQSQAQVVDSGLIPILPPANTRQDPLEYPKLSKEEIAHFWLADPASTSNPPAQFYTQTSLDVYWGDSTSDRAALELTLVYYDGSQYTARKWYLDHTITRNPPNGFEQLPCSGYTLGSNAYQCKKTIGVDSNTSGVVALDTIPLPSGMMLLRARLLYNSQSQPLAVQARGTCGLNCSLPPQAKILVSTGTSGETQRRVRVFQLIKVVPPYFDYAIFSAGEIKK